MSEGKNEIDELNEKLNEKLNKFSDKVRKLIDEEDLTLSDFALWLQNIGKALFESVNKFSVSLDEVDK